MKFRTCLLACIYSFALGQPSSAQHYLGVVGGLNLARLGVAEKDIDPEDELQTLNGIGVGAVIGIQMKDNVFLHLEPMYVQKGGKLFDSIARNDIKLHYNMLELPILLKVDFSSRTVRPYLMAGPALAIRLNATAKTADGNVKFEGDLSDVSEKIDFGLSLGAGLAVPFGGNAFFVEGRYSLGLADINKGGDVVFRSGNLEAIESFDPVDVKTRGLHVMAGFTFMLGR